jgi:hypothetical protein
MTEKEFFKRSYRPYQIMNYIHGNNIIECMIIAVDFDERLFKLKNFRSMFWNETEFWVRCEHCQLPERKLKIVKS